MAELIDTMENIYGELAEIVYEQGMFRAYDGYELLAEAQDFDKLTTKLIRMGFRW